MMFRSPGTGGFGAVAGVRLDLPAKFRFPAPSNGWQITHFSISTDRTAVTMP